MYVEHKKKHGLRRVRICRRSRRVKVDGISLGRGVGFLTPKTLTVGVARPFDTENLHTDLESLSVELS